MERKQLRPAEDIVADIVKLQEEMWQKHKFSKIDNDEKVLSLKINSCLFSGYPERTVPRVPSE